MMLLSYNLTPFAHILKNNMLRGRVLSAFLSFHRMTLDKAGKMSNIFFKVAIHFSIFLLLFALAYFVQAMQTCVMKLDA